MEIKCHVERHTINCLEILKVLQSNKGPSMTSCPRVGSLFVSFLPYVDVLVLINGRESRQ